MNEVIEFIEPKIASIIAEIKDIKENLPKMQGNKIFDVMAMQVMLLEMRLRDFETIKIMLTQ
jgi:hypothetical protein